MCVIAGYMGDEPAAPILLKMLEREEGLVGGYYTGIVTIHEGRLHHAKVVGDVATLCRETAALKLPGTLGLAHSRTPSGGGREWGHPFLDNTGELAYIANGAPGKYAATTDLAAAGQALLDAGHTFRSAQSEPVGKYPTLPNGQSAHLSDIMCQAIAQAYKTRPAAPDRLLAAAADAYQRYPGEIVGLCLHTDDPDQIVAVRHNKPLAIGRDSAGAIYLASATLAFPPSARPWLRMPANTGGIFARDGSVRLMPFTADLLPVADLPSPTAVEQQVLALLRREGACNLDQLFKSTQPFWPEGMLGQKEIVIFEALAALQAEGRVQLTNKRVPGMFNQGSVPQTWVRWLSDGRVESSRAEQS